jgi:hypothetical protein
MELATILRELTDPERVPVAAIEAARKRRGEVIPALIERMQAWTAATSAQRAKPSPLFFGIHLLGEFAAKQAYRPLARLLAVDGEDLEGLLGDAITETIPGVVLRVFDGDPAPLQDAIETRTANEFVRLRLLDAFVSLALRGAIERPLAADYVRGLYERLEPRDENMVWDGWQSAVAVLGLSELTPLVRQTFEQSWVPPGIMDFEDFVEDLERAKANPDTPWEPHEEIVPLTDVIAVFSKWHGYSEEGARQRELAQAAEAEFGVRVLAEPAANPFRHIGRNDPCPCGSGRKFKKCCLIKVEAMRSDLRGDLQ